MCEQNADMLTTEKYLEISEITTKVSWSLKLIPSGLLPMLPLPIFCIADLCFLTQCKKSAQPELQILAPLCKLFQ